mmetsp:Transcript_4212/g.8269  ORF Transcript_4212/g.8269 Transcript_4212/m.8269 type:complete len:210 (+) Transcript_4212:324-953(+)
MLDQENVKDRSLQGSAATQLTVASAAVAQSASCDGVSQSKDDSEASMHSSPSANTPLVVGDTRSWKSDAPTSPRGITQNASFTRSGVLNEISAEASPTVHGQSKGPISAVERPAGSHAPGRRMSPAPSRLPFLPSISSKGSFDSIENPVNSPSPSQLAMKRTAKVFLGSPKNGDPNELEESSSFKRMQRKPMGRRFSSGLDLKGEEPQL